MHMNRTSCARPRPRARLAPGALPFSCHSSLPPQLAAAAATTTTSVSAHTPPLLPHPAAARSQIVEDGSADGDIELTSQGTGTYWYLPPECFRIHQPGSGPRISSKVDVWSLGVIYYQMLYGARPFGEGQSQEQLLREHTMLRAGRPEFPEKPKVSQSAKDFLEQCLQSDQHSRPDVHQLCHHPYLRAPTSKR